MSLENNDTPEVKKDTTDKPFKDGVDNEIQIEQYEENVPQGSSENEIKKNTENKSSKIILYIIYAIVIILCLVIVARNLFFDNSSKTDSTSATGAESTVIDAPEKIVDLYELANLSDGYEMTDQNISDKKAVLTYKNKDNEIVFTQSTIDGYVPEYDITDSDIDISDFHSGAGQNYTAYQIDGKCYIVWTTDEYTFEIKTSMKKSESIPFIFNVQKSNEVSSSGKSE